MTDRRDRVPWRFTFDPRHGFLPCTIAALATFQITEFREVSPGIWFPWKGESTARSDEDSAVVRWEVGEFRFNEHIPYSEFDPDLPVGTPVTDLWEHRKYLHGVREPEPPPPPTGAEWLVSELYRSRYLLVVMLAIPLGFLATRFLGRRNGPR